MIEVSYLAIAAIAIVAFAIFRKALGVARAVQCQTFDYHFYRV